ncbi:MAG: hypothetical protein AMS18_12795 [Gemmatimonas sp. SG8_17]|nr:MAG: hypothetical protein AMS18_12795 [Gemmatimonas sp. SG8_17]
MRRSSQVLLAVVIAGVAIQLYPIERGNPPVRFEVDAPQMVVEVLRNACYDCHSSETHWPWYGYVAPVSWLIAHDVKEARGHFSFSDWSAVENEARLLDEIWEEVEGGGMPPAIYALMHSKARLSDEQMRLIREWTQPERQDEGH